MHSETNNIQPLSTSKKLIFSIIPLLILIILAELGLRVVYFQKTGRDIFAIQTAYKIVQHKIATKRAEAAIKKMPTVTPEDLFGEGGHELLAEFQQLYEKEFEALSQETNKIQSKLLMLYLPSANYPRTASDTNRAFYKELAQKYNADFLDITETLAQHPTSTVTLLPANGHPSRFGNKIIAQELAKYIEEYNEYHSTIESPDKPKLFGDLKPNQNSVWEVIPKMPYRVTTNSQGLRMEYDIEFPKTKQRVLVLGDSYTFGPYLPNHDTYPALLEAMYGNKEVINAAMASYTITDEVSLFMERAKYVEPDITILQVLDNDIYDLFFFKRNVSDRKKQAFQPSKLEQNFLNRLGALK